MTEEFEICLGNFGDLKREEFGKEKELPAKGKSTSLRMQRELKLVREMNESELGRSMEKISIKSSCSSGEALPLVQPSDLVKDGNTSTSSSYFDSDDDDEPKPSELYGMYTWKIEKFSQINERELRSKAFEVGGCKWYILIYPQGCEVGNHLSLFLCVANNDELPPGWSHFAQFTLSLVNKDPKKSKYSDTLHWFMKEEHDWGWKRYMELSKLTGGFIDLDTLIIKAQVQVISFSAFWLGMDQNTRHHMSRENTNVILKEDVKQFFTVREVTSTFVMDALYNGLKTLEGRGKCDEGKSKSLDTEEVPGPIVLVQKGMFVMGDNLPLLLKRAASEPLPPKDVRGPQNCRKDVNTGEDLTELDHESRLSVLGCKALETFILAHIFCNKIMVAYQEDAALKRQDELVESIHLLYLEQNHFII